MNNADWLKLATKKLENAGIGTARLDCLVLLEDATGKDRAWLLAHPEHTVQAPTLYRLNRQIGRRVQHEPLAYIRGKTEFYGREFLINHDVLEPRPESETMIELLKQLIENQKPKTKSQFTIVDVGTGSGALGVTAVLEIPNSKVIATDIDSKCLKVARQNARKHRVDVEFYKGDLLQPIPDSSFSTHNSVILANLPYVPDSHTVNQAARWEPSHAIFGGRSGLEVYRQLFHQVINTINKPALILTESLPFQHNALLSIARDADYSLHNTADFIQIFALS